MKKTIFIANHVPPKELGEVITPQNINLWSAIPKENVKGYINPLFMELEQLTADADCSFTIVLAGEPRAVVLLVNHFSKKENVQCATTFSTRESKDEILPDGTTRKTAFFKFGGLVHFEF
ncbi:hypothetical protein [Campylobacter fetus]|uniref:hypothetical protein n=1 Tax=Campylobacter fetus TaxID=196 RepID=UPI0013D0B7C5|nr:hypothetical protein [Campylobacter fetus]